MEPASSSLKIKSDNCKNILKQSSPLVNRQVLFGLKDGKENQDQNQTQRTNTMNINLPHPINLSTKNSQINTCTTMKTPTSIKSPKISVPVPHSQAATLAPQAFTFSQNFKNFKKKVTSSDSSPGKILQNENTNTNTNNASKTTSSSIAILGKNENYDTIMNAKVSKSVKSVKSVENLNDKMQSQIASHSPAYSSGHGTSSTTPVASRSINSLNLLSNLYKLSSKKDPGSQTTASNDSITPNLLGSLKNTHTIKTKGILNLKFA